MDKVQKKAYDKVLGMAHIGCQDMRKLAVLVMQPVNNAYLTQQASVCNNYEIRRLAIALPLFTEAQIVSATKRRYGHYPQAVQLITALHKYGQKYLDYPKSKSVKK